MVSHVSITVNLNWMGNSISTTNSDGRCTDLLPARDSPDAKELKSGGLYKVTFKTKEYFEKTDRKCFYPWVEVCSKSIFMLSNFDFAIRSPSYWKTRTITIIFRC